MEMVTSAALRAAQGDNAVRGTGSEETGDEGNNGMARTDNRPDGGRALTEL